MAPLKVLCLREKLSVIKERETNSLSERQLAQKFGTSRSQIHRIIKCKSKIRELSKKPLLKRKHIIRKRIESFPFTYPLFLPAYQASFWYILANLRFEEIDKGVLKWFCSARGHNIPVSGKILQEKALVIAKAIDESTTFTASNGWLHKFVQRHEIKFKTLAGQGAAVDQVVVSDWKNGLHEIIEKYSAENIFNIDETGLFYKQTPKKSYTLCNETGQGGASSKLRLTVALLANWAGIKETPIIIGNAKRP